MFLLAFPVLPFALPVLLFSPHWAFEKLLFLLLLFHPFGSVEGQGRKKKVQRGDLLSLHDLDRGHHFIFYSNKWKVENMWPSRKQFCCAFWPFLGPLRSRKLS